MAETQKKRPKPDAEKTADDKEQQQDTTAAPVEKELGRSELEALRRSLQKKFHR